MTTQPTNTSEDMKFLRKAYLDPNISSETWAAFCFEKDIEPVDVEESLFGKRAQS